MLLASGLPEHALRRGKATYDSMVVELMAGQYLDLLEQARGGGSVDRALRVVRYKSAKYTIERPLHLGGELAGASGELLQAYSDYGLPLGEAFQLRDDILGVFGDPAVTGKPAGDDLREGKRTVLIAVAVENASPAQAQLLRTSLGDPALSDDGVAALREVLVDTGALARVESMIGYKTEQAYAALASVELAEPAAEVLADLVQAATARSV